MYLGTCMWIGQLACPSTHPKAPPLPTLSYVLLSLVAYMLVAVSFSSLDTGIGLGAIWRGNLIIPGILKCVLEGSSESLAYGEE